MLVVKEFEKKGNGRNCRSETLKALFESNTKLMFDLAKVRH